MAPMKNWSNTFRMDTELIVMHNMYEWSFNCVKSRIENLEHKSTISNQQNVQLI